MTVTRYKNPKTPSGRRTLSAPTIVLNTLEIHVNDSPASDSDALLFTSRSVAPPSAASLQSSSSRARASIECLVLHLHDLRHTGLILACQRASKTATPAHRRCHKRYGVAIAVAFARRNTQQRHPRLSASGVAGTEILSSHLPRYSHLSRRVRGNFADVSRFRHRR